MTRRALVAAAIMLLALVQTVHGAQPGPLCTSLGDTLGLDANVVQGLVNALPDAPTRSFCTWCGPW